MARKELGPASLRVAQAVERAAGGREELVVGCSGGADSLALAAGVAWLARKHDAVRARALVVDHGLQEGSSLVAYRAAAQCEELGLPAMVRRVAVPDGGLGPEAEAREARYTALAEAAGPEGWILVGHTLDDQAETVLLGLARGSGARSLAGMAERRGRVLRPLLRLRRDDTQAACAEWGLEPWQDPHNQSSAFARVRVRRHVLPVLEAELGPGIAEALARTAQLTRDDADFLDELAERVPVADTLPVDDLGTLPRALRRRVLRRWLIEQGVRAPDYGHVQAVADLVEDWRGQQGIDVPGARISRADGVLRAEPRVP